MLEVKDPTIKLFGKTISLPSKGSAFDHHHHEQSSCSTSEDNKSNSEGEHTRSRVEDEPINPSNEESSGSEAIEIPKTPGGDAETSSTKVTPKEEPNEPDASREKKLKKPDKILPCPRCNSMDTKFCYYNNYNVNQPRHFCRKCQRYWTAGGTMRNVPVGSGRRKNKNSCASNYCHIMVSDAFQAAQADACSRIQMSSLKADETVLAFSAEKPLCESRISAYNLSERGQNGAPNGIHVLEQRTPISFGAVETAKDHPKGLCSKRLNLAEQPSNAGPQDLALETLQGFPPQGPCFPSSPIPSKWSTGPWGSPTAQHTFSPSGFPVTFYPACSVSSPWNVTWLSLPPSSPNNSALSTTSTSPTLGKHYRDGSLIRSSNLGKEEPIEEKAAERNALLSKTLRIDGPNESSKSSICLTLGIKSNKKDPVSGPNLFNAFHPGVDEKNYVADTALILQANPAALSRSINFHEST